MTIKELKEAFADFHDNMEVRYTGYDEMENVVHDVITTCVEHHEPGTTADENYLLLS